MSVTKFLKIDGKVLTKDGKPIKVNLDDMADVNECESEINEQTELATQNDDDLDGLTDLIANGYVDGSPRGVYDNLLLLQSAFPTGAPGVYLTSNDGHWYYWNSTAWTDGGVYQAVEVADGSITPNKTSFLKKIGINFNEGTFINGKYLNYSNGVYYANANYCVSDYFEVTANETIYFSTPMTHFAFYTSDKTWITCFWGIGVTKIIVPSNAVYMKVSCEVNEESNLNKDNLILSYNEDDIFKNAYLLSSKYLDIFKKGGYNRFDKQAITSGYYKEYNTGKSIQSSTYFYSNYINVSDTSYISILIENLTLNYHTCFFNEDYTYLSGSLNNVIQIPSNAKYMVVSCSLEYLDNLMVLKGIYNKCPKYKPYTTISSDCIGIDEFDETQENYVYRTKVKIGTNEKFTTMTEGFEFAFNKGNCDVYIDGVFDLIEEQAYTNDINGLKLGKNNNYYFSSKSKVFANYSGVDTSIRKNFSCFYTYPSYGNFEIHNLNVEASNVRYCIHDEMGTPSVTDPYKHAYYHNSMKMDNTINDTQPYTYHCIGAGLGTNGEIIIDGCEFESIAQTGQIVNGDVSYHGNWSDSTISQEGFSRLIVKNNYFANNFVVSTPNFETQKKKLIYTNNSSKNDIFYSNTSDDYWDIKSWNNVIRTN